MGDTYNQIKELTQNIENEIDDIDPMQLEKIKLLQLQQQIQHQNMENQLNKVVKSASLLGFNSQMIKETILVIILFIIFSLSIVNNLVGIYVPILGDGDFGPSILTLILRGILVGGIYLFIKRFFIVNS